MVNDVLLSCPALGKPCLYKGKVREMYDLGNAMLMVATDRLSAFDVIFPDGIPGKGKTLTQLSALWFQSTRHIIDNHMITTNLTQVGLQPEEMRILDSRSMVVRKAERIDVECVVRGYLAGSGWKEYRQSNTVVGIRLPAGLQLSSRLPEPIFTPALKNDVGHDENVPPERVAEKFGKQVADSLRETSLQLYEFAAQKALEAGIIIADTKFEFGWVDGRLTLIDEVFTPDSSRFWPVESYAEGRAIDSLDKQPIRDYVEAIGWNKEPPAPHLPPEVILRTSERYQDALRRLQAVLVR